MPKMTKSQIAATIAEKVGIKKKQAAQAMEELATLAYKEAKNTFVVPGLGKLVLVQRPARKMVMRFGPKAGQEITVPAKKVVKFRLAKAAKDAILKK
jgi:DNA-binding protein HU-beta